MTLTLPARLERTAAEHPNSTALILGENRMTYAELQDQSQRLAGLMRQEGIGPGDRVALMAPNIPAFPVVFFAALQLGAVVVPMNPLFKRREIEYYLEDSGASMLWSVPSEEAVEGARERGVPLRTLGEDGLAPHLAESPGPVTETVERDLEDDAVILLSLIHI